jgi:uncharacterized membrane protein YeaQ/YmgE (transglycosylase-associated protein family)
MSIVAWIILGLVSGYVASHLVSNRGEGMFLDAVLGVVGALVGGFAFNLFGVAGVTGLNLWSMFVSVVGAALVLVAYHSIGGRHRLAH